MYRRDENIDTVNAEVSTIIESNLKTETMTEEKQTETTFCFKEMKHKKEFKVELGG